MNNNPYEILHLQEDATYDEIKQRYRHLTKNLHPDKQPLQNYQATKRLFEQIDEAYKSISSPLRRFLFRQYGLPALKIIDEVPAEFAEFEGEVLTQEQTERLRQLMVFLLYDREAGYEMDKTKFISKTLVNVSKTLRGRTTQKKNSKRNLYRPQLENTSFEYEMVLPQLYGFSNSVAVSQTTSNIRTDPKYALALSYSAVRRLHTQYMLAIQTSLAPDDTNFEVGIDKICEHNLHLKFTPLVIHNMELGRPKFGVEKAFSHYQFSAVTDLYSTNFDFTENNNRRLGRSLKLYMEKGSLGIVPKVQWQLTRNLRLFVQISFAMDLIPQQNNINLRPALTYGYRLTLTQDLKLQLSSSIGSPNYFQLSFISSKFRAAIPFISSEELASFELYKISLMLLTYFSFELYHYQLKRNQRVRARALKEQESRLKEQQRELGRQKSYIEMAMNDKKEKEIKYNGLVILRAYLGEKERILKIAQKLELLIIDREINLAEIVADVEQRIDNMRLISYQTHDEAEDVTALIQNEVIGAQILNYPLHELNKYSPCLFEHSKPYLLIYYIDRGTFKTKITESHGSLSLGGLTQKRNTLASKINSALRSLTAFFLK